VDDSSLAHASRTSGGGRVFAVDGCIFEGYRKRNSCMARPQFFPRTLFDLGRNMLSARCIRRGIADGPYGSASAADDDRSSSDVGGRASDAAAAWLAKAIYPVHSRPALRWPAVQWIGHTLSEPAVGWLAAAGALVGWHVPSAFTLALHSEWWHAVEHATFLAAGFLFWWPVVQPWPSVPVWSRWTMLPYLFSATLPCDMLSAFLTFCAASFIRHTCPHHGRSEFPLWKTSSCAGALMWTCVTFVYLVPATI